MKLGLGLGLASATKTLKKTGQDTVHITFEVDKHAPTNPSGNSYIDFTITEDDVSILELRGFNTANSSYTGEPVRTIQLKKGRTYKWETDPPAGGSIACSRVIITGGCTAVNTTADSGTFAGLTGRAIRIKATIKSTGGGGG